MRRFKLKRMITRTAAKAVVTEITAATTAISNTNTINQQATLLKKKPSPSRVDYNFFNYCSQCDLKLSKQNLRCPDCKQKVRTKPWHRSKVVEFRRI